MINFPESFTNRIKEQLGDEYEAFLESYDKPFHNGIRINKLKVTSEDVTKVIGEGNVPVPWNPDGYYIEHKKQFSKHPYYHAGLYYIQEASAMLPAHLVNAQPGEKILDLCAAPGGKSTAVAAALRGQGVLVSNDVSRSRAKALLRNLEAFGIRNFCVTSEYPQKLRKFFPEYFDKVLIDAPCSGEGMFHKEPGMTEAWLQMGPDAYHKLQKDILTSGVAMLKPGGTLVYSTCTFSPQEDEGSIAWLLETYPELSVLSLDVDADLNGASMIDRGHPEWADGNPELSKTLRLWPHHLEGEGHFAAVLKKSEDAAACGQTKTAKLTKMNKDQKKIFESFFKKEKIHVDFDPDRLTVMGTYVQYVPEDMPETKGMHVLRNGWFLGEFKKDRFEPSGAFARGLNADECGKVVNYAADDPEVIKYLKCETLNVDENLEDGWYLVTVDGYALGWGKVSRATMKNKYPSGWRLV